MPAVQREFALGPVAPALAAPPSAALVAHVEGSKSGACKLVWVTESVADPGDAGFRDVGGWWMCEVHGDIE